ncbi:MAG: Type 1 glutamine amidotransferase-like domain-containing protein [Candidatus Nanopelagicaceae bacterium]
MAKIGALALVGSGEYLPVMQDLERALLESGISNGKPNRYLQIPTAAGQESRERLEYWEAIGAEQARRIGAVQEFLPIFKREDAFKTEFISKVKDAGLIYFSGGDPGYLATALHATPLWEEIETNWRMGAALAGCSAGAMALSSDVPNFFKMKNVGIPGLNAIPNLRPIPHYNKFFGWIPDSAAKIVMKAPEGTVIIGIDEDTALVSGLDAGNSIIDKKWQVHGKAGVHILSGAPTSRYLAGEQIVFP